MIDHDRDDYIERKLIHLRSQLIAYQDMIERPHSSSGDRLQLDRQYATAN